MGVGTAIGLAVMIWLAVVAVILVLLFGGPRR